MVKHVFFYLVLLVPMAVSGAPTQDELHTQVIKRVESKTNLRVLFVGNSYSFNIPRQFAKLASDAGKKVQVEQVTKGGWTLKKHAGSEQTLEKIKTGKWDFVVLQEQSQIPSFHEKQRAEQMNAPAKKLVDTIRASGAQPVFFLTWGRQHGDKKNARTFPNDTRDAMQQRLNQGYTNVAIHVGGAYIVPVGKIWSATMRENPDTQLYTRDGSHPARLGNLLGASVFYTAFYNETPKSQEKDAEVFLRLANGIVKKTAK